MGLKLNRKNSGSLAWQLILRNFTFANYRPFLWWYYMNALSPQRTSINYLPRILSIVLGAQYQELPYFSFLSRFSLDGTVCVRAFQAIL